MKTCDMLEMEEVAAPSGNRVYLPLGLLGFESIHDYVLIGEPEHLPFYWLQAVHEPGLAFLVVSPFEVMPSYEMDLAQEDVNFLKMESAEDALVYNIVTLRAGGAATVNLKGPIVLNRHTRAGKQVVLANAAQYALQHPIAAGE